MVDFARKEPSQDGPLWCSECGRDIHPQEETMWIERRFCRAVRHGRPWLYSFDQRSVLVCRDCFYIDVW